MTNYVTQAATYFKQGDYQNAKKYYTLAAKQYGQALFNVNLMLCEKHLNGSGNSAISSFKAQLESIEVKKLSDEISFLKRQLNEKDANINERFEELAILTRMLEERDAVTSA